MSDVHGSHGGLPERIHKFVVAGATNELTDELWTEFEQLLRESDEACRLYVECVDVSVLLPSILSAIPDEESSSSNIRFPEQQQATFHPAPGVLGSVWHGTVGYFSSGWPVAYLVATVVFGIGLLVGTLVHVSHSVQVARQPAPHSSPLTPLPSMVGRITGMVDCTWADPSTEPFAGAHVPLGRKYALASGLMEITYDTGAKVILQGPVTYEVESAAGGYLSLGKLTARLEKGSGVRGQGSEETHHKSEISGPWPLTPGPFSVRTPTATVTDLGTEFGVEVSKEGHTTSRVFRGSVKLQATSADGTAETVAQVLHENQSARVNARGENRITLVDPSAKPTGFVRAIPKRPVKMLDLVDVVAGGNGFSGRRNRGIDPTTGQTTDAQPNPPIITGNHQYHGVEGLPFIDGVFVPDGSTGPVQINSAGQAFADCPPTTNTSSGHVWAGGRVPLFDGFLRTEMGGVEYASPGHGVLGMHANKGITFDLAAIRRANPGRRPARFRSTVGNTEIKSQMGQDVYADVWVFVDGQIRFQLRRINASNGAIPIGISLDDRDRFLTLVATDGGNPPTEAGGSSSNSDWIIFGDPQLELVDKTTPDQATEGTEGK